MFLVLAHAMNARIGSDKPKYFTIPIIISPVRMIFDVNLVVDAA